MTISLQALTSDNWKECAELQVRSDQEDNVDTNLYCIAESKFEPHWEPLAVYAEDTMVGMAVIGNVAGHGCVIHHLMIDRNHQEQGCGRAAILEAIRLLRTRSGCETIKLSYWPGNPVARLYESLGFEHTGETWDEEPVMILRDSAGLADTP